MDSSSNLDSSSINASKLSGFGASLFFAGGTGGLIPLREAHFNPRSFRAPAEPAPRDMDSSSNLDSSSINAPKLSGFGASLFFAGGTGDLIPLREVSLSVAALSERLRQLQIARHSRRTCRLSSLSLRGAKRRGNLAVPYRISRKLRQNRNCLPEIAASAFGLLAMTRQVVRRYTSALTRLNIPVQGGH